MSRVVTVIYQINCSPRFPVAKASLWVVNGFWDGDNDDDPYPEDEPRAIRVAGPDDTQRMRELKDKLGEMLAFLGFQVRCDDVPDD